MFVGGRSLTGARPNGGCFVMLMVFVGPDASAPAMVVVGLSMTGSGWILQLRFKLQPMRKS